MRIAMLGAGAMGSVIGGHLAAAGNDVDLIDIDEGYVTAVNSNGLVLETDGIAKVINVRAAARSTNLQPVDLVMALEKSFHTEDAMRATTNLIGPETTVLSLQNGLGQEELLASIVGRKNVIAGKTYVGGVNGGAKFGSVSI